MLHRPGSLRLGPLCGPRLLLAALAVGLSLCWWTTTAHASPPRSHHKPPPDDLDDEEAPDKDLLGQEVKAFGMVAFDGHHRPGHLVTVFVELENVSAKDRLLNVSLGSSDSSRLVEVDLAAGGRKSLQLLAVGPDFGSWRLLVTDRSSEELLDRVTVPTSRLSEEVSLLAYIGKRPPGLKRKIDLGQEFDDKNAVHRNTRIARVVPAELPERAAGFSSLAALFWSGPKPDALSAGQMEALRRWVLRGGHLVLAVDEGWRRLEGSGLEPLLPFKPQGLDVLQEPSPIGAFLGPGSSFGGVSADDGPVTLPEKLPVLAGSPRPGAVIGPESYDKDNPLTWTWRVGDGRVTLWRTLPQRTGRTATLNQWSHWLSGRANPLRHNHAWQAVRQDEPKLDVSIIGILLILLAYVGIIGPLDFLVLRQMKRLEWTVITYPAAIAVFSLLAWLAMINSVDSQSFEARYNLITWHLPDSAVTGLESHYNPAGGSVDVNLYYGHFPTTRQRMSVSSPQPDDDVWLGRANYFFGPMASVEQTLVGSPPRLDTIASAYALVPFQLSAMRQQERSPVNLHIDESPDEDGSRTEVKLSVENRLDVPLSQCWARWGTHRSASFFDVAPGQKLEGLILGLTGPEHPQALVEGWEPRQSIQREFYNAAPLQREPQGGELVCMGDALDVLGVGLELKPKAESTVRRGALRFLF